MAYEIVEIREDHPLWASFVEHAERVKQSRWVIEDGALKLKHHVLVAAEGEAVVGHVSVSHDALATKDLDGNAEVPLMLRGDVLTETFVATFAVDETHRRRGIGTALQRAAIELSRRLGAYQMRSWSSSDRMENFALKLSLGFGVHPEKQYVERLERAFWGVYFVKCLRGETQSARKRG